MISWKQERQRRSKVTFRKHWLRDMNTHLADATNKMGQNLFSAIRMHREFEHNKS